jgi:hypothetical protein
VLLVARWAIYAIGPERDGVSHNPTLLSNGRHTRPTRASSRAAFDEGWAETLAFLESQEIEIFVFQQTPDHLFSVPNALARAAAIDRPVSEIGRPRSEHDARHSSVRESFESSAREGRITTLDPVPYLCDSAFCRTAAEERALYIDSHHLSPAGAHQVARSLDPLRPR